ncbi:hypothetical protein ACEWBT_05295 [Vibrio parahaemolyticus]|uniref:hypothetical protein n=1 Tax=Vibrio parahaemolyticus TaxID=670 RepID=UPI001F3744CD|nr:hypothetical protein [Vibrio parahaemolyticus]
MLSKIEPVFQEILLKCNHYRNLPWEIDFKNAIISLSNVPGKEVLMMAITIRNTDEHKEMLDALSELTEQTTMSKALIKGGYMAISYKERYELEKERRYELEHELRVLRSKANNFVNALKALSE